MSEHQNGVLALGAHPDDVELIVGGSLLLAAEQGLSTAICHLTAGEMGTRGTVESRRQEAEEAAAALNVTSMEILGLPDGKVSVDLDSKDRIIRVIRKHRPKIILAPYWEDLHPDHQATGRLIKECAFLSGLVRWETDQEPWRAERVLYYMSHTQFEPDLIVDISDVMEQKKAAAESYRSQFHQSDSKERSTFISDQKFWHWWEGRAAHWGHLIGVAYGEPFCTNGPVPTRNPFDMFDGFGKYKNDPPKIS